MCNNMLTSDTNVQQTQQNDTIFFVFVVKHKFTLYKDFILDTTKQMCDVCGNSLDRVVHSGNMEIQTRETSYKWDICG